MKPAPGKHARSLMRLAWLAAACAAAAAANTAEQDKTRSALNVRCGEPEGKTPVTLNCLEENMVKGARVMYADATPTLVAYREVYKTANASCDAYVQKHLYKDNCHQWRNVSCHWSYECDGKGAPKRNFTSADFVTTTSILRWTKLPPADFANSNYKLITHPEFLRLANAHNSFEDAFTKNILILSPDIVKMSGILSDTPSNITRDPRKVPGYKINHTDSNTLYISTPSSNTDSMCKHIVHDEIKEMQKKKLEEFQTDMEPLSTTDTDMAGKILPPADTYEKKDRHVCGLYAQHALSDMLAKFHTYSNMLHVAGSHIASCDGGSATALAKCRAPGYSKVADLWKHASGDGSLDYCSMAIQDAYVECMPKCACADGDHYANQSAILINLSNVFRPPGNPCLTPAIYDEKCGLKIDDANNLVVVLLSVLIPLGLVGVVVVIVTTRNRKNRDTSYEQVDPQTARAAPPNGAVNGGGSNVEYSHYPQHHPQHHTQHPHQQTAYNPPYYARPHQHQHQHATHTYPN